MLHKLLNCDILLAKAYKICNLSVSYKFFVYYRVDGELALINATQQIYCIYYQFSFL